MRDLVHRSGYSDVKAIRAGKFLRVQVQASDDDDAKSLVQGMCDDLRIYNPAAHSLSLEVRKSPP